MKTTSITTDMASNVNEYVCNRIIAYLTQLDTEKEEIIRNYEQEMDCLRDDIFYMKKLFGIYDCVNYGDNDICERYGIKDSNFNTLMCDRCRREMCFACYNYDVREDEEVYCDECNKEAIWDMVSCNINNKK